MPKTAFFAVVATVFAMHSAGAVNVGIVTDGPTDRPVVLLNLVKQETERLLSGEFDVSFPDDLQRSGDWTPAGVRAALDETLADPDVDIVITLGLASSTFAAQVPRLRKPVIAAVVPDPELQGFPIDNGVSGKRNLTYISSFRGVDDELAAFHEIVGFTQLTIIADELSLKVVPGFRQKAERLAKALDIEIRFAAADSSPERALSALPPETEAVYVTPLWRLSSDGIEQLAAGLAKRGLPSLTLLGRSEVEAGLLMSVGGLPADDTRFARRVALNLQRILLGENPANIEVGFQLGRRLLINMRTAREIGFLPRWAILIDAEKLFDEEPTTTADELSLRASMREAVESNLSLSASEIDILIAGDDVRTARSSLLPQLNIAARRTQIDEDRANPLAQAEKSVDAELSGTQVIYSDPALASVAIAREFERAAIDAVRSDVLDTLQISSTAFLSLLRAQALEAVRRSNLEVTRTNLELARARESIGASGRADVLRWESEIAGDRQALLAAQATLFQAATELNRVLNRRQSAPIQPVRAQLVELLSLLEDPRFDSFVGNPVVWETFIDFSVTEALKNSPELSQFGASVRAQVRDVKSASRARYLPEVALSATAANELDSSGAGSDRTGLGVDDKSWSVAVQASIPVFNGGALKSRVSRSRHALSQLERQKAALAESIEARMRVALHQVGGSYPAIELSQDASRAAVSNLELVTDAYSKGAVSITDLIDAQDAALSAELAAAEAEYAFLIDYMEVLRARGAFDLVLDPATVADWYTHIEAYFRDQGVKPLAR